MPRPVGSKNRPGTKPGPKKSKRPNQIGRDETEKEETRERISYLLRMGYSQTAIAKEVGLSQPMVSIEAKKIRERCLDAMIANRQHMIWQEYQVIMDVRRKAEEGLRLATGGKKKVVTESGENDKGGFSKDRTETEELLPPSEYMHIILKTNERICDLFGLDEAVKTIINVDMHQTNTILGEDSLLKLIQAARSKEDPIQAAYKALEDQKGKDQGIVVVTVNPEEETAS